MMKNTTKRELIQLDQEYTLDVGSLSPIKVKTIQFNKEGVLCKGEHVTKIIGYDIFEHNGYQPRELIDFGDFKINDNRMFEFKNQTFAYEAEESEDFDYINQYSRSNYYVVRLADEKVFCQEMEYCHVEDTTINLGLAYEVVKTGKTVVQVNYD